MKATRFVDHKQARAPAYPDIGEQLDMIVKTFAYLHKQGVDIGADGRLLVAKCQAVKQKFKNPSTEAGFLLGDKHGV